MFFWFPDDRRIETVATNEQIDRCHSGLKVDSAARLAPFYWRSLGKWIGPAETNSCAHKRLQAHVLALKGFLRRSQTRLAPAGPQKKRRTRRAALAMRPLLTRYSRRRLD